MSNHNGRRLQLIRKIVSSRLMQLSNIQEFLSKSSTWTASRQAELGSVENQFPFSIVVEGAYSNEFDIAERWCWQTFGPRDGECDWQSEYPGCPVILAAEKTLKTFVQGGQEFQYMAYSNPTKHSHTGTWTTFWLGKTGYGYGFGMFFFSTENDKTRFINHVPEVETEIQAIWASQ